MRFSSIFVFATAVVAVFSQTVADIEADIATLSSQVTSLDTALNNYPSSGGTLAGALAIHSAIVALENTLDDTTSDVTATPAPVSESDAQAIIDSLTAFWPILEDIFEQLAAKKPAFDALPIGGVTALIKQDINNLCPKILALLDALIAAAPDDLKPALIELRNQVKLWCNGVKPVYA